MKGLLLPIITITCIAQPLFGLTKRELNNFFKTNECEYCDFTTRNFSGNVKNIIKQAKENNPYTRLNLKGANLKDVDLSNMKEELKFADLSQTTCTNTDFTNSDLSHAKFTSAIIKNSKFNNAILDYTNFYGSYLKNVSFKNALFEGFNFLSDNNKREIWSSYERSCSEPRDYAHVKEQKRLREELTKKDNPLEKSNYVNGAKTCDWTNTKHQNLFGWKAWLGSWGLWKTKK